MAIFTIIIIVVAVIVVLYVISIYNRFINLKNGIESGLKQINVALKKRMDLVGQIVQSVKGGMKFEKSTLTQITALRNSVSKPMDPATTKKIANQSGALVKGLMVQVEAYPDLKSNQNVQQLINSLNQLEEEISRLRYTFNNTVQEFNTKSQMFPSNMVAGMFGFSKQKYLELGNEAELKTAPDINLDV